MYSLRYKVTSQIILQLIFFQGINQIAKDSQTPADGSFIFSSCESTNLKEHKTISLSFVYIFSYMRYFTMEFKQVRTMLYSSYVDSTFAITESHCRKIVSEQW